MDRLRQAARRRGDRWDALCLRCGRCCFEKDIRGFAVVTNYHRPCAHLDARTHLCTVYDRRFAACAACRKMTLAHALFTRWLPEECGYVQHYRPWRRKTGASARTESKEVLDDVISLD